MNNKAGPSEKADKKEPDSVTKVLGTTRQGEEEGEGRSSTPRRTKRGGIIYRDKQHVERRGRAPGACRKMMGEQLGTVGGEVFAEKKGRITRRRGPGLRNWGMQIRYPGF